MRNLLLLLFVFTLPSAYSQVIQGSVRDADGGVLPFASILVKGTQQGVTANKEGIFNLRLPPGTYTLQCRYVGYSSSEKVITVGDLPRQIEFVLRRRQLALQEVIIRKGDEDPAYAIIRHAIQKRPYYAAQVKAFEAQVYIKGMIRVDSLPEKIMGQKVPDAGKNLMGLDASGNGIVYLTESVTKVYAARPNHLKLEVLASRVSGNNGLGFGFPAFISFYDNNVDLASALNPRGFVSPIADNALRYYDYRFLGSFFEGGQEVNAIRVIPKRPYEPLFSGIINITEDSWRIYSCQLALTRTSALEILDSLEISQLFMPVTPGIWRISSQVVSFGFNPLGIRSEGNFVNVYSRYKLNPNFAKGFFDRVVIAYDSAATKKTAAYWDSTRPIPLEPEELSDYRVKDSAWAVRQEALKKRRDSLEKMPHPVTAMQLLWSGIKHSSSKGHFTFSASPLLKTLQYNTVEGIAINPSAVISIPSNKRGDRASLIADVRYGFNNHHLNPWAGLVFENAATFDPDKKSNRHSIFVAGGKRVSQFFKESDIDGLGNSIATLLYGTNALKIYENRFVKSGYSREWESGVKVLLEGVYEDRLPLDNTSLYILDKSWTYRLTPNYPVEIMDSQFTRHQAVILHVSLSFQPGQRYAQFPEKKVSLGSTYPVITIGYSKGIRRLFGSAVDYDKWSLNARHDVHLGLAGVLKYNVTLGGFLNRDAVFPQDYKHYYGNQTIIANQYVRSFQNATYYQFSNDAPLYAEWHLEHHSDGLISSRIPLLKKWNWNFVEGANLLYVHPGTRYAETFIGLENIFKFLRVDLVVDYQNGYRPIYTCRIGFDGLLAGPLNYERYRKTEKIIGVW